MSEQLSKKFPIIEKMTNKEEIYWENKNVKKFNKLEFEIPWGEVIEAEKRLERFSEYLKIAFPESNFNGIIESDILNAEILKEKFSLKGDLYLKLDNMLPISGSIKARGGIYEVLVYAEKLLIDHGLINKEESYKKLLEEKYKKFFSKHTISVGSTGNLGLSIGIMAKKLGFNAVVHMSKDAKTWKKNKLKYLGVEVVEYAEDYTIAVEKGRKKASLEKNNYFVDDENSKKLFVGYAVAAIRLKRQLEKISKLPTKDEKLHVYIPCGVGGGPGGIAYGLKYLFKDLVKIYFIEPLESPCMALSMITDLGSSISVSDIGLSNDTDADGLAVGKASELASSLMKPILNGIFTISDKELYRYLLLAYKNYDIILEPSAAAGFKGIFKNKDSKGMHLIWCTGGKLLPENIFSEYLNKAKDLYSG